MHANTPVGQTQVLGTNGLHTKLDGTPGENLANHYQPVYPVTQSTIWIPPLSTSCLPPFGCFQPFDHCIGSECLEAPCVGSGCPQTCLSCEFGDFASGRKALSSAPVVDRAGYTFVGPAQPGSGAAYDVQRTRSLTMGGGGWTHLAGCL